MENITTYPEATIHGEIKEVFENIFFVTGSILMAPNLRLSRNMIIIREGESLSLISAVRLNGEGLKMLDSLGKVENIIKLGAYHLGVNNGMDDAFYINRYDAKYWAMPGVEHQKGLETPDTLLPNGSLPFANSSLFAFETSKMPEGLILIPKEGGVLISADSLQNWTHVDPYFSEFGGIQMQRGGFIKPANIGPEWFRICEPQESDFNRIEELEFQHVLPSHGVPLMNTAKSEFKSTFKTFFNK